MIGGGVTVAVSILNNGSSSSSGTVIGVSHFGHLTRRPACSNLNLSDAPQPGQESKPIITPSRKVTTSHSILGTRRIDQSALQFRTRSASGFGAGCERLQNLDTDRRISGDYRISGSLA